MNFSKGLLVQISNANIPMNLTQPVATWFLYVIINQKKNKILEMTKYENANALIQAFTFYNISHLLYLWIILYGIIL